MSGAMRRVDGFLPPENFAINLRLSAVMVLFLLFWLVILGRVSWLVMGPNLRLDRLLAGQHEAVIKVAPKRGSIVDRLGRPLAVSVDVQSLFADPARVEDPAAAAELLAPFVDRDLEDLQARLSREGSRFVWLARQLPHQISEQIRALDIPGVHLTSEAKREYPSGALASQLLGFVGIDGIGLEGIEARYNDLMMGDTYQYRTFRDGRRRALSHAAVLGRQSTEGDTLVLSIDHNIQHRTEQSLAAAIERAEAKAGSVLVLDARSGAVLASASAPSYDPNSFRQSSRDQRRNRAISDSFEPGSTMKAFVLAEVLEEELATPEEEVYCEKGAFRIGRRTIHDTHAYANITVSEVLKYSSNIGTAKLGERLGPPALEAMFRRFGFGARTGIDVWGEEAGILHPSSRWSRIGFANHCFGQGMAVTGVQLTAAFAALVNGGHRVQPHVITEVRGRDGTLLESRRPEGQGERLISAEVSEQMRVMLGGVVEKGGTGTRAALDEYTAGGKTGTAQKVRDGRYAPNLYVSSFIGFAPRDDPRIVVLTVIDEPTNKGFRHFGGTAAGPVFKEVATYALQELGVAPDKELPAKVLAQRQARRAHAQQLQAERARGVELPTLVVAATDESLDPGWLMPDLRGLSLRDAARVLVPAGVEVQLLGSGLVGEQEPAPGVRFGEGQLVRLALVAGSQLESLRR
ncbi:MAG: penicillin-binding protein [Rickettsiales bacterium]|nr:penicillin-binding protein [Rickettsiales bacterium]